MERRDIRVPSRAAKKVSIRVSPAKLDNRWQHYAFFGRRVDRSLANLEQLERPLPREDANYFRAAGYE
jgi:hypothetical protein